MTFPEFPQTLVLYHPLDAIFGHSNYFEVGIDKYFDFSTTITAGLLNLVVKHQIERIEKKFGKGTS